WVCVVRLLDNRDGPHPITGIERASTRLIVLRKSRNKGNTSQQANRTAESRHHASETCSIMSVSWSMIPIRKAGNRLRTQVGDKRIIMLFWSTIDLVH